ncbi:hypothetical protein ACFLT9_06880 [Acidobacteriota bacterium]
MKVLKSYLLGIKKAIQEGKMVGLIWLFNVLFAGVLYFQVSGYLNRILAGTGAAEKFLKTFDMNTLFEMLIFKGEGLSTILSLIITLIFVYLLANIFINGGILHTLANPKKRGEKRRMAPLFFEGAGKYFGRFFRLCIYSKLFWVGLIIVIIFLNLILDSITRGGTNEGLMFYLVLIRVIIVVFLVFLIKMVTDYARIQIVAGDSRKVFLSLFQAFGFVLRKFWRTLALYYLFVLTSVAIFYFYGLIGKTVKTHALIPILISFALTQVFILSRGWVRVGLQAAQLDCFLKAKSEEISSRQEKISESAPVPEAGEGPEIPHIVD